MPLAPLFLFLFKKSEDSGNKRNDKRKNEHSQNRFYIQRNGFEKGVKSGDINRAQNDQCGRKNRPDKFHIAENIDLEKAAVFAFAFKNMYKLGENK